MPTAAVDGDPDVVGGGEDRAGVCADPAGGTGDDVLREGHVGHGDDVGQTVLDHAERAAAGLLGRLEERDHRAPPRVGGVGEEPDGTEQAGGVHVVAA